MGEDSVNRSRRRAKVAFSRLTLTIVIANLVGPVTLLLGSFAVTQYRDGLMEAKFEAVRGQAQIIADVLGQIAIVEADCGPDDSSGGGISENGVCPLILSRADVKEAFNGVWDSFEGRVRIFDTPDFERTPPVANAAELLIEDVFLREDDIVSEPLPPLSAAPKVFDIKRHYSAAARWLSDVAPGGYRRLAAARTIEAELNAAIASSPFAQDRGAASVRVNQDGELVASVSIPIRRVQAIYGVVTAEIGGIDDLVDRARWSILPFFGLACFAAIISSMLLTARIARPIRQLSVSADRVREGITAAGRARIPDFAHRRDEIGELSVSLREMTQAIYERIDAIERFAADVAHELKNPLTSIRSASETLQIAKTEEARDKLLAVIANDVTRMDRLITDISNASRLDAELAREGREPIELTKLVTDIVSMYEATASAEQTHVVLRAPEGADMFVFGNPGALGQVFRNLIDNARSFSPQGKGVLVVIEPGEHSCQIRVDDEGPGVPVETKEKIFSRFYTKRPAGAAFGANSGLGLAISRQIVRSHSGRIWVENIGGDEAPRGARFIVELPLARSGPSRVA